MNTELSNQSRDRKGASRDVRGMIQRSLTVAALIVGLITPLLCAVPTSDPPSAMKIDATTSQPASSHTENERLLHWRQTFFWAAILVLILFIAVLAIIRFTLRYRAYLFRERPPPTPSEDVWQMHRLPEDDRSSDATQEE